MYYFYSTLDPKKEPINKSDYPKNIKEAYVYFSKLKNMSIDEFTKIYSIEKK